MKKNNYRELASAKQLIAGEEGTIFKNWGGKLPVALVWPNTYRLGMSSLALHTLYGLLNAEPDVVCERVFLDAPLSLESQRPLDEFALVAFSISYELDYFNVLTMLQQAGFPLRAEERDKHWPLLIAGGPAVYTNPEPLVEIFDAFAIGEGEAILPPLLDALWEVGDAPRHEAYARLAEIEGLYLPALSNGPVSRVWVRDLEAHPTVTQIYTHNTEFGDRTLIEIARGCGRGCRFCMAGYVYRPMRELHRDTVLALARQGLQHRARVGLVSAAVSDHSWIDQIATELRHMGVGLSASSMRVDPLSEPLVKALAESGNHTLTIAPEAGTMRLRQVINKPQTDAQILSAVELAAKYNFPQLKLYFMTGHPSETEEDLVAVADLVLAARKIFTRSLVINATPYVPKSQTAFQWAAMAPVETLERRLKYLQERLTPHKIALRADSPSWAAVEGVLARGDRRLGGVLRRLAGLPKFNLRAWHKALEAEHLEPDDFLRERSLGERLPWEVVNSGVAQAFFSWELQRAHQEAWQPACPPGGCLKCRACDPAWAFRPAYQERLGPNLGGYGMR
jgi:radical SAM superfamily enzyme YgiQ (UPF0313 family)